MNSENLWNVFCATGKAEHYLLYSNMKKQEQKRKKSANESSGKGHKPNLP